MGIKVPRITIDKEALKNGIWGNTWETWGYILLAFLALYAVEAGYFTGLLFAAKDIRGHNYKTLPNQYMGGFERTDLTAYFPPSNQDPLSENFNRPDNCKAVVDEIDFKGQTFPTFAGYQECTVDKDNTQWSIFPWVADTKGLDTYPACANAATNNYATVLDDSSPAFSSDEEDMDTTTGSASNQGVCQNFLPAPVPQSVLDVVAQAAAAAGGGRSPPVAAAPAPAAKG